MNVQRWALGQPVLEIQAAMEEENCIRCFGCPNATMRAAELVHRTNLLLNFTYNTLSESPEMHPRIEEDLAKKREELGLLTRECGGYSDVRRDKGRPAKMCDSAESGDYKISIIAGRILEFLRTS